jgi:hypothetical protein
MSEYHSVIVKNIADQPLRVGSGDGAPKVGKGRNADGSQQQTRREPLSTISVSQPFNPLRQLVGGDVPRPKTRHFPKKIELPDKLAVQLPKAFVGPLGAILPGAQKDSQSRRNLELCRNLPPITRPPPVSEPRKKAWVPR